MSEMAQAKPRPGAHPRYVFVVPPVRRPTGGVNVIVWAIETLRQNGYDAVVLFGRRDGTLFSRPFTAPCLYSADLDRVFSRGLTRRSLRWLLRQSLERWRQWVVMRVLGRSGLTSWTPRPEDVLVLPEFMYPEVSKCFSGQRRILFVQGYMVLLEATLRDPNFRPAGQGQFAAILAASQACATAVQAVFGVQSPILRLPVCRAGLTFNPDKKLQIAYMPRRRRVEVKVMERLIAGHPDLAHIPLVPIDEVSEDEAHHILRESLIFLSFSEKEGFGLPPAEAMATGCLVVGYTGVGGEEYFTAETGFPVPDGDLARFVETLVGVVRSWRQDRRALEDRRRHASDHIWQCYTEEIALGSLRGLWAEIDAKM